MKINAQKKQYVSPEIEVFMLEVQKPLLDIFSSLFPSNTGGSFGSPMPLDDDEDEEEEEE